MTDTYATPAVQEEPEMTKVKEIFDRALNALVDASSLAKTVEQLKTDLEGLKVQVTHYRNTISNQDDQITRLRQDRDAARTAQYQAEDNSRHINNELVVIKRENDSLTQSNVRLNERISEVSKERDEAQFKLLELQEAHTELTKKLESVQASLESVFSVFKQQQKAEPVHEVAPQGPVTPLTLHEPEPVSEPTPEEPSPQYWPDNIQR